MSVGNDWERYGKSVNTVCGLDFRAGRPDACTCLLVLQYSQGNRVFSNLECEPRATCKMR
jgi:hypothetical protein